jgi:ABC-2 type transport system permease protein
MSSATAVARPLPQLAERARVTLARVVLSEWTKFHSLRSTRWSLVAAMLLTVAFPIIFALVTETRWGTLSAEERASRLPTDIATGGLYIAQLAIAVLGVLVISGEYSTGTIRATFTAVPKRLPVLWAKLGIFAAVSFVLTLPAVLIAFFASQAILARKDILQLAFTSAGVPRVLVGGALYVMLVGIFALGLGAIVRSTAGAISTFAGIWFVIPPLMNLLPSSWNNAISQYLPSEAGRQLFQLHHAAHSLTPTAGGLLMLGYCALVVAIAAVLMVRRDT